MDSSEHRLATMDEVVVMSLCALDTRRFYLRGIEVDSTSWNGNIGNDIIVPDGHELVLRQEGHTVRVIRRIIRRMEP